MTNKGFCITIQSMGKLTAGEKERRRVEKEEVSIRRRMREAEHDTRWERSRVELKDFGDLKRMEEAAEVRFRQWEAAWPKKVRGAWDDHQTRVEELETGMEEEKQRHRARARELKGTRWKVMHGPLDTEGPTIEELRLEKRREMVRHRDTVEGLKEAKREEKRSRRIQVEGFEEERRREKRRYREAKMWVREGRREVKKGGSLFRI